LYLTQSQAYHDIRRLPVGIAGIFSCCCAAAMAVLSMSQTWYKGPIASKIGGGGDIGFEVS
jgi:purine-cytosine permease-like protein